MCEYLGRHCYTAHSLAIVAAPTRVCTIDVQDITLLVALRLRFVISYNSRGAQTSYSDSGEIASRWLLRHRFVSCGSSPGASPLVGYAWYRDIGNPLRSALCLSWSATAKLAAFRPAETKVLVAAQPSSQWPASARRGVSNIVNATPNSAAIMSTS